MNNKIFNSNINTTLVIRISAININKISYAKIIKF